MTKARAVSVLLLAAAAVPVSGWGRRGHALATRLAVAALPADLPAFFRQAGERLAYQASEPDRWRGASTPALTDATGGNHSFATELWGDGAFPALAASTRPRPARGRSAPWNWPSA